LTALRNSQDRTKQAGIEKGLEMIMMKQGGVRIEDRRPAIGKNGKKRESRGNGNLGNM